MSGHSIIVPVMDLWGENELPPLVFHSALKAPGPIPTPVLTHEHGTQLHFGIFWTSTHRMNFPLIMTWPVKLTLSQATGLEKERLTVMVIIRECIC